MLTGLKEQLKKSRWLNPLSHLERQKEGQRRGRWKKNEEASGALEKDL